MKIAALDIGGTDIKYCLYDTETPFSRADVSSVPTNAKLGGEALMAQAKEIIASMGTFDRIGVSTAGQVDPDTGRIIFATDNIPGYTGTQVGSILREAFGRPAAVENDVNAAALGEACFGAAAEYRDFLCLTFGTGIGGAIVHDRRIFYGSSCSAGEFGHILTHAGGRECTCGNRGCYEAYASTGALSRAVRAATGREMNGREIFALYPADPVIRRTVEGWVQEIVWGLASLIHAFNPPCVILGGGIMNEKSLLQSISQQIPRFVMSSYRHVVIRQAALGNAAGLLGAAQRAMLLNES
jgi:predicted NBD/HSP70 family sugar kinase